MLNKTQWFLIDYCLKICSNGLKFEKNRGQSKNDYPVLGTPAICSFLVSETLAICDFPVSRTPAICDYPASGTPAICDYPVTGTLGSHFKTRITPRKIAKIKNGSREPLMGPGGVVQKLQKSHTTVPLTCWEEGIRFFQRRGKNPMLLSL